MARSTMLLLLLLTPALHAQTVQKCVGRDGQARYQSEPCGPGSRTAEVWDAVPEPTATRPAAATAERSPGRRARTPRSRRYALRSASVAAAPDACEQARSYREEAERRAGLARNYELLSTLQRRVFEACR